MAAWKVRHHKLLGFLGVHPSERDVNDYEEYYDQEQKGISNELYEPVNVLKDHIDFVYKQAIQAQPGGEKTALFKRAVESFRTPGGLKQLIHVNALHDMHQTAADSKLNKKERARLDEFYDALVEYTPKWHQKNSLSQERNKFFEKREEYAKKIGVKKHVREAKPVRA
ncbi:MAG: hypothetical protein KAW41_06105 [Candidatus Diapherotrites archaeon]|nr:hypothetical protein [Candidatus Diapherotrites archaeon]